MKRSSRIILYVVLALSVCLNIVQLCISSYRAYASSQKEPIQAGTYLEDPEQFISSNLFTLERYDRLFYYHKNDGTTLKQGRYEIKEDGTGVLYQEDGTLCGYAVALNQESIQVIWTDDTYIIFGGHQDAAILPASAPLS